MTSEFYTPGHNENATEFMAKRTLESHGSFFIEYLERGISVLDCGCGPGSITLGIAACTAPGEVVGIDFMQSQIDRAAANATRERVHNARFETANCYSLPFENATFDRVFCYALMEHLADPVRALTELYRVLKPAGVIGACSPDWGGFVLSPPSPELSRAVDAYMALQSKNVATWLWEESLVSISQWPVSSPYACRRGTYAILPLNSSASTWHGSSSVRETSSLRTCSVPGVIRKQACLLKPGSLPSL